MSSASPILSRVSSVPTTGAGMGLVVRVRFSSGFVAVGSNRGSTADFAVFK